MKSIPIELADELAAENSTLCHLISLGFATVRRYTDFNEDIFYNGNWYYSRGLSFDSAEISLNPKIDSISFEIDNVNLEMTGVIMSEEVRNSEAIITRVAIGQNLQVIGAITLFVGYVDSIEAEDLKVRFELYNHMIRWKMTTPRRQHESTCRWTFKDTDTCKYAGSETWCDHSWGRCVALFNQLNFPGFRWLLSIQNKQLWWGRAQR